ncbi:MAG: DUF1801 domain-containing protein [Bacteroidetes bacterium]|nr:DUF1801 domain-containing protein [Bacteroidota bacterium]
MAFRNKIKFHSYLEFWEQLSTNERQITDVLRQIITQNIAQTKEKLAYNVPYYYGKRRICFIWPASIPFGGFKNGVMLGFCYGNLLPDIPKYLIHGTNKQVYYRIFHSVEEINESAIVSLLQEAIQVDHKHH